MAIANRADAGHHAVITALAPISEPFVVPLPVLPEVDHPLSRDLGSTIALSVIEFIVSGSLAVDHLVSADLERATVLMREYDDARLGFVDSCIIALAERLNITCLVTLDRRHFTFVRPRHCDAFVIVP